MVWNSDARLGSKVFFFNLIATKFGKLIKIDSASLNWDILTYERILIHTPYHKIPKKPLPVSVDGEIYSIWIKKEEKVLQDTVEYGATITYDDSEKRWILDKIILQRRS